MGGNSRVKENLEVSDIEKIYEVDNISNLKKKKNKRSLRYALVTPFPSTSHTNTINSHMNMAHAMSASIGEEDRHKIFSSLENTGLEIMHSGVFNWIKIFGGDYLVFNNVTTEELEYYDVLHVNMHTTSVHLPRLIRRSIGWNTKTKVILTPDFPVENILEHDPDGFPVKILEAIDYVDYIFCTNEVTYQIYDWLFGSDKVCYLEHPTDVEGIRQVVLGGKDRVPEEKITRTLSNRIGVSYPVVLINTHRWDRNSDNLPNIFTPYLAVTGNGYNRLKCVPYISNVPEEHITEVSKLYNNNYITSERSNVRKFWDFLSKSYAALDYYTASSYGRFTTESGALGVPTVCNRNTDSAKRIFPDLAIDMRRPDQAYKLLKRLLSDAAFRNKVIDKASKNVEHYNYKKSKARFMKMLKDNNLVDTKEVYIGE